MARHAYKRGQSTLAMFFAILIALGVIFFIIIGGIISAHINTALTQNITIGQVNLATIGQETWSQYNSIFVNHADFWGIAIIGATILGLFTSAYLMRGTFPKFGFIFDVFFIVIMFILSLYLASTYSTFITAMQNAGENFAQASLPNTSFFILHLPWFVAIIGAIMMVIFHAAIPPKPEEVNIVSNIVAG